MKAGKIVFTFADIFLLIALIVLGCTSFFLLGKKEGNIVEISEHGKVCYTLLLTENKTIHIEGKLSVDITDGKVKVIGSHCKDKLCERSVITHENTAIVCLPQGIAIEIKGDLDIICG